MKDFIKTLSPILFQAGSLLREFYAQHVKMSLKKDGSPVTDADIALSDFLIETLEKLYPEIPVVSEERLISVKGKRLFWMLDPLDGTRQFLQKTDNFSINLALIEDKKPVLGFIMIPMQEKLFVGCKREGFSYEEDKNSFLKTLKCKKPSSSLKLLLGTHKESHEQIIGYIESFKIIKTDFIGSAIKFFLMAQGEYDLYLRTLTTGEWDTAAGQAIVEAAGGQVTCWDGSALLYGKGDFLNSSFVVKGNW